MFLQQVPAPRTDEQDRGLVVQGVMLAFRAVEGDRAVHGIHEVDLALDGCGPGGAVGVFEVGHVGLGPGVEGVDDHLAVHRAGDFHAAVLEVVGNGGDFPVALPDGAGFREKIRQTAIVDVLLDRLAAFEKGLAPVFEFTGQGAGKAQGLGGQHPQKSLGNRGLDVDTIDRERGLHVGASL